MTRPEYEPVDLFPFCNAGVELYDPATYTSGGTYLERRPSIPPTGQQCFHGLPFQIGAAKGNDSRTLLGFGQEEKLYQQPIQIPVGKEATHLIFAHAVLETELWRGGALGTIIAQYIIHYQDGGEVALPIRERFEIGNVPVPWGQYPFLCVPDQIDNLEARYEGSWERTGFRFTEVGWALPQGYFLWAWPNPQPDKQIRHVTIVPGKQKFVLAALTLSHLPEYPFVRTARRPVKLVLLDEQNATRPFDLAVELDRGVATYPYTLPKMPMAEADPDMAGFGAPVNDQSSPAYTEIAALPSATLVVRQGDQVLGQARWGELEASGRLEVDAVRIELIDPGRNWVKVRVLDDETGQPIPCRIAFHSPEGMPYPPHGHHAPIFSNLDTWNQDIGGDVRLGQISYACIDGTCEGWLPRGRVWVDVARGYEYEPVRTWQEIEPGQQALTLRLKRWINMNETGYYSGDTHVHFLSSQGSHTEARSEDLNVVNLLQSQWGHLFSNTEEFTGRPHVSADGNTIVYVSQENRQHILGHLSLLGLKTPVMPWASGGPPESELGGSLEVTLSQWADMAHAQGGTVILPHIPTPNGEPAALIATGRADAVEMLDFLTYEHQEYYRYLNGGYRLPLVGGTDKMAAGTPVGLYRTYVQLLPDQEFTYENWCRALRAGRTFLSGGALLWLTVEGRAPGDTLSIKPGGTIEVEAVARSIFPLHTLQIVQEGRVIAETTDAKGSKVLRLHTHLKVTGDSWLAARCAGPNYTARPHFDDRGRGIMAHTSPVYLTTGEEYGLMHPETAQYMLTLISGGLAYLRERSPQYPPEQVTHFHGRPDHLAELERPFHEAAAAIHRRLHDLGLPH